MTGKIALYNGQNIKFSGDIILAIGLIILKKLEIHAQWSVFESLETFDKIKRVLLEEGENFRFAIFRINPKGEIKKIGKDWEKVRYLF